MSPLCAKESNAANCFVIRGLLTSSSGSINMFPPLLCATNLWCLAKILSFKIRTKLGSKRHSVGGAVFTTGREERVKSRINWRIQRGNKITLFCIRELIHCDVTFFISRQILPNFANYKKYQINPEDLFSLHCVIERILWRCLLASYACVLRTTC